MSILRDFGLLKGEERIVSELKAPLCPECRRPLQRSRTQCLYCGYRLNENEQDELEKLLTDEAVEKHLKKAQALMDTSLPKKPPVTKKPWFKALVILLSVAVAAGFSWISEWNVVVIALSLLFFSIPVWHVLRR